MAPDIQKECRETPKSEEEVKPKDKVEKELSFRVDAIFSALLFSIVRAVLEESIVRLAEEMVRFRRSTAEQMSNCPEQRMNDTVNLLKLHERFRAGWNKWLETPHEQRVEEAFKVLKSCLFDPEKKSDDEEAEDEEAER